MQLTFDLDLARQKPTNSDRCPFCSKAVLGRELGRQGEMLWVENLYPTLADTYQTVVIESDWHEGDIPDYSTAHNRQLFAYLYASWKQLEATGDFASVLLYRNFGPLSGGSLRHPHSQIVGLKTGDPASLLPSSAFQGVTVQALGQGRAEITLSQQPLVGYCEFNLRITDPAELDALADACQSVLRYLKTDYFPQIADLSYNLFFYDRPEGLIVKIMPRLVASPYFLGYGIRLVDKRERLSEISRQLKTYLSKD